MPLFKTFASCLGALAVVVIVATLLWKTIKQESARPTGPTQGILTNGPGLTQPVRAFTTTEMLGDYLLAAAARDSASVARICGSSGAVTLEAGTKAVVLGISGPGQTKVRILSGVHKDQILYVNYAAIEASTPETEK
jgi:hypothetical protein